MTSLTYIKLWAHSEHQGCVWIWGKPQWPQVQSLLSGSSFITSTRWWGPRALAFSQSTLSCFDLWLFVSPSWPSLGFRRVYIQLSPQHMHLDVEVSSLRGLKPNMFKSELLFPNPTAPLLTQICIHFLPQAFPTRYSDFELRGYPWFFSPSKPYSFSPLQPVNPHLLLRSALC